MPVVGAEELVNVPPMLKLPYHTGQGRAVVVKFAIDESLLPGCILKECQDGGERDAGIAHHIGKAATLVVVREVVCERHFSLLLDVQNLHVQFLRHSAILVNRFS